jgi:FKBP12-rapamycin complex-associated protein
MGFKEHEEIDLVCDWRHIVLQYVLIETKSKTTSALPPVLYAYLKHQWYTAGNREELENTFKLLQDFSQQLSIDIGVRPNFPNMNSNPEPTHPTLQFSSIIQSSSGRSQQITIYEQLLAKCYLKLGDWQVDLQEEWDEVTHYLN